MFTIGFEIQVGLNCSATDVCVRGVCFQELIGPTTPDWQPPLAQGRDPGLGKGPTPTTPTSNRLWFFAEFTSPLCSAIALHQGHVQLRKFKERFDFGTLGIGPFSSPGRGLAFGIGANLKTQNGSLSF